MSTLLALALIEVNRYPWYRMHGPERPMPAAETVSGFQCGIDSARGDYTVATVDEGDWHYDANQAVSTLPVTATVGFLRAAMA